MKDAFHKIVSITMAMLLLLSTISWKVEKHYCMGRLVDVALFVDVESCDMGMFMADYKDYDTASEIENSCCDDEVILVEGQDDFKISFNDLNIEQQVFLIAFEQLSSDLIQGIESLPVPSEQYPPPRLIKNIQLLDEVFLI
jgi:hypothetical protein